MSKVILTILAVLLLVGVAWAQPPDTSNVLDNIVIEESFEGADSGEEKLPIRLELDFNDLITVGDDVSWISLDEVVGPNAGPETVPLPLKLSSPQFANIRPAPVKTFHASFRKILRWQLDITAADGRVFRTISGQGTPPGKIAWDGTSNSGKPLVAGASYAYNFTAIDKAGNRRTFAGETFSVPAFYLFHEGTLLIGVADSELFSREQMGLRRDARQYAQEIASLIRYFSKNGTVSVASASSNAQEFLRILAEELICDPEDFGLASLHSSKNSLTFHVE